MLYRMSSVSDIVSLAVGASHGVQEGIPATCQARDALLGRTRAYVRAKALTPPLQMEHLADCTDDLLASAGLAAKFRSYAAVLLNNELWRDTLAGIPFNKRLLLLPQCLRDAEHCSADVDQLGLVCNHCGRCPIHDIQSEAESLGYVVLVAEGSPVVTSLIESGQVEGVIGVSCLSMLERVFPYMEAAAIPGLAVPLLCDGCRDTSLDTSRVWDAIHLTGAADGARLDLDDMRRQVDTWFAPQAVAEILGAPEERTEEVAQEWLAGEGKRWRPLLVACAYQALCPKNTDGQIGNGVRHVALAIECFHKASLVHDDIEDADAERYGRPTLHEIHGTPFAINVGDLLVGEGYRLIAQAPVADALRAEMLAAASAGHRMLCLGQGAELYWARRGKPLTPVQVIDVFTKKTSPAFEVALHLGAICAGAGDDVADVLREYSRGLGVAYQIRDDLEDLIGGAGDLEGRRPSIVPAVARVMAKGRQREMLDRALQGAAGNGSKSDWRQVREILARLEVAPAVQSMLDVYKDRAIRSLFSLNSVPLKRLLRRLVAKIFGDVEPMDCCNEHPHRDA